MPTYEVAAPDGRRFHLEGDSPPSEADLDEVFKAGPPQDAATALEKARSDWDFDRPSGKFPKDPNVPEDWDPDVGSRVMRSIGESKPVKKFAKGMDVAGKALVATAADAGEAAFRPVTDELYPEQATEGPLKAENLEALKKGEPLPAKDLRVLGKPGEITGAAAQGLLETTPRLAAVAGLEAVGVPAGVTAPLVFGPTEQGFDPNQAAIASALPFVGKYSGAMTEALASKLGISNEAALTIFDKLGGATGAAALLKGVDEAQISQLPPEERDQARINSWAGIAGQAALGMMGGKEHGPENTAEPVRTAETPSESKWTAATADEKDAVPEEVKPAETKSAESAVTPAEVPPAVETKSAEPLPEAAKEKLELPAKPTGKGIGGGIKAALEKNQPGEAGFINIDPLKDLLDGVSRGVKASIEAVSEAGKEAFSGKKMTDYRRSVLNWSMKLQRSFQEAHDAQKEIKTKVPDPIRREGITNWIQADGDAAVLRSRSAASNPKLKKGYEAALSLTPEELAVARDVKRAYDAFGRRANRYGILNTFKQNYVTQIWDLGRKAPSGGASSRTLRDKFRFSKASTFATFFDGEQAGFTPKTKDISKLLPVYIHEMNSVIAARQLVEQMAGGVASDGRPLLAPRGVGMPVNDAAGNREATLVMPKAIKEGTKDYRTLGNQPALTDWRWAAEDADGKPIFLKGDLAIHPEAFDKFKNVLGKSAISEWYNSKTSAGAAIPKALVKGLDLGQSEVKRTMLGLFAPFHQVQEGTHAVGHRVNPFFNIPKVDLIRDAAQADAAKHGLMMLPDRASEQQFMEGFRHSGLVSRIPGIGAAADWYSHYLFHEYIPGLKYKTYQAILDRNMKAFESNLRSGEVAPEDVKVLSAEQANAAYGHLNYADLGRNPTVQHMMRLVLLAPDFLEARGRFAGQALKGLTTAKVGREQLLALATLAIAQTVASYTAAKLTGGDWDAKHPFEFVKGNRRYRMRSVPEDAFRLVTDTRAFIYARLNPIIGKGTVQYLSGVDWRGQKKTALQTTKELAQQPVPLTLRGFVGLGNTPLNEWEQLASAVGIPISRYSAQNEVYKRVDEFKKNSKDPKLVAEFERRQKETMADSDYKPLREALEKGDTKGAKQAYADLLKTKKADLINRAMQPYTVAKIPGTDYWEQHSKPFTGSKLIEQKFVKSLSPEDKAIYAKAKAEREERYRQFKAMLKQR